MTPDTARVDFATALAARGLDMSSLDPRAGIGAAVDFYRVVRSDGCIPDNGDGLLFQWGTYDWGAGGFFEIDLTRQFISAVLEDDDALSQLHLTWRYAPTVVLPSGRESGNRWCFSVNELPEFTAYLEDHTVLVAVVSLRPAEISLQYDYV